MIPDHLILISSDIIQSVPVQDNGESLVELVKYAKERNSELLADHDVSVREGLADKLINAQELLPEGYLLKVVEGYRSPEQQKKLWKEHKQELAERHPDWDEEKVELEASKLYAPPGSTMPHAAGSAVDVTLADADGLSLNMGTNINDDAEKTENKTYTLAENISDEQKKNRQILIDAMGEAGFVNYATEWWHWSAGDQYWAFFRKQPFAVYGEVKGEAGEQSLK